MDNLHFSIVRVVAHWPIDRFSNSHVCQIKQVKKVAHADTHARAKKNTNMNLAVAAVWLIRSLVQRIEEKNARICNRVAQKSPSRTEFTRPRQFRFLNPRPS